MMDGVVSCHATAKCAACAALLAGLLGPLQMHAATSGLRTEDARKMRAGVLHDLAALATIRPKKCIEAKNAELSIRGWRASTAQCAWQNRLQMRRWEADQASDLEHCVSRQALWWARARSRATPAAGPVAWNGTWSAQSLIDDSGPQKRVAIIERSANGSWVATEWRWTPSPRAATRKWQEGRWKLLTDAAIGIRQSTPKESVPHEVAPLLATWEKNLRGRAGEVAEASWLWERDGLCMRMETVGLSQAQLHLPYSKEDGRLEQRAAMQLRLARTYPKATWLTPFRLLPMPNSTPRGGAKYEAIWIENATVKGQLWMPGKVDGAVLRARIAVALPAKKDSETEAAAAASIAQSIDSELIGLATTWAFDNER